MSAISSIGGTSPLTYLQQLQQRGQDNDHDGDKDQAFTNALSALGVDPSKASTIQSQIQQAIKDASSNSTSDSPTDRRTAVQQAIDGVLKNNGIDPAQFKSQLQAQFQKTGAGRHHHHHGGSSTDQTNTTNSPGQNAAAVVSANASSSGFSAVV